MILCTNAIFLFSGFVGDQREYNDRMNNKTHPPVLKSGPGMIEPVERFRLNNLSFAGPVIMGVGGKKFETGLLTGSNIQFRNYKSWFFMTFKPIIVFWGKITIHIMILKQSRFIKLFRIGSKILKIYILSFGIGCWIWWTRYVWLYASKARVT